MKNSTRMKYRVALMGIYHESNTFIERPTTLDDFRKSHLLRGQEIRTEYEGAHHEISGMLEVMDREEVEVVPLLFAEATPGGMVTASAYAELLTEVIGLLKEALPVDGCLVVPHGAGVSESEPDMDGHWLGEVRKILGKDVPVVGTLDPHANVSVAMEGATDALIAYKTNPHVDQRQAGRKAASLLMAALEGGCELRQHLMQPQVTISIEQQHTEAYPCTWLYEKAAALERQPGILSVSILLGFPYADVHEMGTSFLVVSDNQPAAATQALEELEALIRERHSDFVGKRLPVAEQLGRIASLEKPVLLLDMGDNVGGGSPGDSVYLLAMLETYPYRVCLCVFDPEAVKRASEKKTGDTFTISIGRDYTGKEDAPFHTSVTLLALTDGRFKENEPKHGGQVRYDMGPTAIVRTAKGNTVLLHSLRVPPFSLSQLTTFGIHPADFDVVVAKGVNAPIAAYGPVCPSVLQLDTPGVTQADMTAFEYVHRRRPLFPFEPLTQ